MKCAVCNISMKVRSGKFGDFYYCVNQHKCGQKTVTKHRPTNSLYELTKDPISNFANLSALEIHQQLVKDDLDWLHFE